MWLVSEEDKKFFLEFFGRSPMPWSQSNPFIMRIAAWKKVEDKKDNGKDKPQ